MQVLQVFNVKYCSFVTLKGNSLGLSWVCFSMIIRIPLGGMKIYLTINFKTYEINQGVCIQADPYKHGYEMKKKL